MLPYLSTGDARRLEAAVAALLSPLDAGHSPEQWLDEARARLRELIGADRATLVLTTDAPAIPEITEFRTDLEPAVVEAYRTHYHEQDVGTGRIFRRGVDLAHQWTVVSPEELLPSAYYNEWFRPAGLHDAIVMTTGEPGVPAGWVSFHHDRRIDERRLHETLGLLRAVQPAFKAGVALWRQLGRSRASLSSLIDAFTDGAVLYDRAGRVVHANPAFLRLVEDDPRPARLHDECRAVAVGIAAALPTHYGRAGASGRPPAAQREIRTERGEYRLRGIVSEERLPGEPPLVLVVVERTTPAPVPDSVLRERYGLTRRECTVARLVAEGLTNEEIAERLFISPFTARNHVERILAKLGVARRTRVASRLHGTGDAAPTC